MPDFQPPEAEAVEPDSALEQGMCLWGMCEDYWPQRLKWNALYWGTAGSTVVCYTPRDRQQAVQTSFFPRTRLPATHQND